MRKDFWDSRTQMYYCMPLWMHFLGQRHLEILVNIFRIQIRLMKGLPFPLPER